MDTDAQHAPITTADDPFNDPTDSVDLVIRTADRVDFFILSALLSLRSPSSFFRHILPGYILDTDSKRDGFPVFEVEDDSDTFRTILLFCYPYMAPEMESVQKFRAVGEALDKYRMDRAMERFVQAVLASSMISEQPLRMFAVAVANGWKTLGEAAARNILATPFNQAISDVEELNELSARNLLRLEEYHVRCGKAAQIQVRRDSLSWLRGNTSGLLFLQKTPFCQWCGGPNRFFDLDANAESLCGHAWLTYTYFQLVNTKLLSEPWPQVALDDHIIDQTIFASTKECGGQWEKIAGSQVRRLGKIVGEEIGRRISKVPLYVEWSNKHQNEKDRTWDLIWKVFGMKSGGLLRPPPCDLFGSVAKGAAKGAAKLRKFSRPKAPQRMSIGYTSE